MFCKLRWWLISPNRKKSPSSGCFFELVFWEWALMMQRRFRNNKGIAYGFLLKKSNSAQINNYNDYIYIYIHIYIYMNYLEIYIMIIKWLSPWGGAAVGLDSAQREQKCKGQATDMVLICNTYTHTQSHPHTHPHTHTQYIISTLNYVLN